MSGRSPILLFCEGCERRIELVPTSEVALTLVSITLICECGTRLTFAMVEGPRAIKNEEDEGDVAPVVPFPPRK